MTRVAKRRWLLLVPVVLSVLLVQSAVQAAPPLELLERHGDAGREFEEVVIGDKLVYYHVRMIGEALVEKNHIVYQLDAETGDFLARKSHWRDDLPEVLPAGLVSREAAESLVGGEVLFSHLCFISPESDVFPIEPTPMNPCWVVRSLDEHETQVVTVVDAVEGVVLGNGLAPPYGAFSLAGPRYSDPCRLAFEQYSENAADWFEQMGYPTQRAVWPTEDDVRNHLQSAQTALFYEYAHGHEQAFASGCFDGEQYLLTRASHIEEWIADYSKMPFTFLGSCDAMCATGDGTLSYEFRKGSIQKTAAVGYCHMSHGSCTLCWYAVLEWQDAFFSHLSQGNTVGEAFVAASAAEPWCGTTTCIRMVGDEELTVVPVIDRRTSSWKLIWSEVISNLHWAEGLGWGDFDIDGDPDIYLANADAANVLLHNDAGIFTDATAPPLDDVGPGRGVAWGDYDNDGDLDLYLTTAYGGNRLFRNDRRGFTDVTTGPIGDPRGSSGVAWADYDLDGDLDLYVANVHYNRLYENMGAPTWNFALGDSSDYPVPSEGVAWGDYDNDGDPDLLVANRGFANRLYRNDGGVLVDATPPPIGEIAESMGAAWGDYDNDGDLDAFFTNMFGPNKLLRNDGEGAFTDVTTELVADTERNGTGVVWLDFDNDGDLDLYVVNEGGHNRLFQNEGAPAWDFVDATVVPLDDDGLGRGVACADYDKDGDLDIYLANAGPNLLFQNNSTEGARWLQVTLEGTVSNRSAIGTRVRVVARGASQIREVSGGSGYLSQDSLPLEFGLGSAAVVDSIVIRWPSGFTETFVGVTADQIVDVVEGTLSGVDMSDPVVSEMILLGNFPNPFNPVTLIQYDLPAGSTVTLTVHDLLGRRVRELLTGEAQSPGRQSVPWDARDERGHRVASGVYFYRLEAGGEMLEQKMLLLK